MTSHKSEHDHAWIDAFIERLRVDLPNVSPRTLRSVLAAGVEDDRELRQLPGRAAAERWIGRRRSVPAKHEV